LPIQVAVVVVVVALLSHNSLLGLGAGTVDCDAVVVFWQTVLAAELSAAEWTAEWHH